ncbi:MAG: CCA tRNA nucleotidyltransferase [Bacillota bacterium]|nr:CCA tRNA nucleotidyltransferase [Bacillota bacterium]
MRISDKAAFIIERLENAGYEAYAVGGCVRDSLLGKEPYDWDICTKALPDETKSVFADLNVIETGIKHGTVTIIIEHEPFEVTTFRVDGDYLDNRRPESVKFVRNIEEDLSRRDFTVNAMAYSPARGLIDLFGGMNDLMAGRIVCVGDAKTRFCEDALRIIRGLRFASVYGYEIEENTARAMTETCELLKNIAAERINTEFTKLLEGKNCKKILTDFTEIFSCFFPAFSTENWLFAADAAEEACEPKLRLAAFFCTLFPAETEVRNALHLLKYDNAAIKFICSLSSVWKDALPGNINDMRKALFCTGYETMSSLAKIRKDAKAQKLIDEITEKNLCCGFETLAVGGHDIKKLGVQGKQIGKILETLLFAVMEDKTPNNKEELIKYAENLMEGGNF